MCLHCFPLQLYQTIMLATMSNRRLNHIIFSDVFLLVLLGLSVYQRTKSRLYLFLITI